MKCYLALLRGVNVGGHALLGMAALKQALAADGFNDPRTFIQSGNVFFAAEPAPAAELASKLGATIKKHVGLKVDVVVFDKAQWQEIIDAAPQWWGKDPTFKHSLLVLLPPHDSQEAVQAAGALKPGIETMQAGPHGVVYQSLSRKLFGRTTASKLISNPIYKQLTIRNYNTSTKLLSLFDE